MESSTWYISSMMNLFQFRNPRVQWGPAPTALREYVDGLNLESGVFPRGLTIMLCMIASGRSSSLSKLLHDQTIEQRVGDDRINITIDKMGCVILTAENESKGLNIAEGSTSEEKRSALLCNVNNGYH
eukprot:7244466-Pyramimonas_sp.AAC.1